MTEEEKKFIASLPPKDFLRFVKLAIWIVNGIEEHGLEINYWDGELLQFRVKQ